MTGNVHPVDAMTSDNPAQSQPPNVVRLALLAPIPNYTLSSECPACGADTVRRACKVRCERCGFMWDCSEL